MRPRDLRFYHAMYQLLMFAMDLALVSNNIGLMWVAIEVATLTTVVMVGIYRTSAALEAAWKYFILGSVGIALALFGTILVYLAAQEQLGQGMVAMAVGSAGDEFRELRSRAAQPVLHLSAARLRHESGSGARARLASGRARGGSHADFRRAVGPAAERRALCAPQIQADHGRQSPPSSRPVP